jgi:Holliday junction resolvase
VPDIFCCVGGKFVAIELKQGKNETSELQNENIRQISQSGGIAFKSNSFLEIKDRILQLQSLN